MILAAVTGGHTAPFTERSAPKRKAGGGGHSPVLSAVDVQHVGVRVLALDGDVAGRVAVIFPDDAKAVDAGDLCHGLTPPEPREKPAHLVRQVV